MRATISDHRSDVAVLHLQGELDSDTASQLHGTIAELLERPVPRIVVDLTDLKFCDSVGLSAFITCKQVISPKDCPTSQHGIWSTTLPFVDATRSYVGTASVNG